jgi:50S ribosomal protein L16 3-hydroxylase
LTVLPGDFDADAFLRDHWQKSPCVVRGGGSANPLSPDELAGLACEDEVESRLVTRTKTSWKLEHGPFPPSRFAKAATKPWTLLVQSVDHAVPAVAALIEPFRFVPNWRIDDVMVSYATDGGGVGPHFDQYDVFLVQGAGQRKWRVGGRCDATTPLLPHDDLRLLASFDATGEWLLGPGDILYVPPGFAHDGVAVGDGCMTYSVGFRAPSRAELVSGWCDHLLDTLPDDDRFTDPGLRRQDNPGEITADTVGRLHDMVRAATDDRAAFARWFGEFTTAPKRDVDWRPDTPVSPGKLRAAIARGTALRRNPASRFSFFRSASDTILFVDGQSFACDATTRAVAELLCQNARVVLEPTSAAPALTLIAALIDRGSLALDRR